MGSIMRKLIGNFSITDINAAEEIRKNWIPPNEYEVDLKNGKN
jgi:hypothetical protein